MKWYLAELDESQDVFVMGDTEAEARKNLQEFYQSNGYTSASDVEDAILQEAGEYSVKGMHSKLEGNREPFRAIDASNGGDNAVMWEKRANMAGSKGIYQISLPSED